MSTQSNQIIQTNNKFTKTFSIPLEMFKEIESLVEQRKYRSNSDFAREAFQEKLDNIKNNNGDKQNESK